MARRDFLRDVGFGVAVAALPTASYATERAKDGNVIGPFMLERVCDHEKSRMSAEEWQDTIKRTSYLGCGTRFRWYWGTACVCPNCGWTYLYTLKDLKDKVFLVDAQS